MKKIYLIILLTAVIMNGFCLRISAESQTTEKSGTTDNRNEATTVTIGKDLVSVEKNDSSLNLNAGNRRLTILESLEGPRFRVKKFSRNNDWDQDENESEHSRYRSRFRGHWSGIELGLNNFTTSRTDLAMPADIDYMTLHSSKSTNFNINFTQLSLGLGRHIGFVTGLGLNWNNYRFDGNNNIIKGTNGVIEELDPGAKP